MTPAEYTRTGANRASGYHQILMRLAAIRMNEQKGLKPSIERLERIVCVWSA